MRVFALGFIDGVLAVKGYGWVRAFMDWSDRFLSRCPA